MQLEGNTVLLGVTPVPGGGEAAISQQSGDYQWPRWEQGRRTARFIVATVTPGGPPLPTATPLPTPVFGVWSPPEQPDYSGTEQLYTAAQFIENFWEPLRLENPDYITRAVLGRDASDTHDIYAYSFTPPEYEKTFLITANLHGYEILGQMAMYRFMDHLVHDYAASQQLSYLRERVRFIVVPMVNPWGVDQRVRHNVNAVDINRNFDYLWENYSGGGQGAADYKGPSPFSEPETRVVRDLLASYPDADVYFDIHNGDHTMHPYTSYIPVRDLTDWSIVNRVTGWLRQEGETERQFQLTLPYAINYARAQHGVLSLMPEVPRGANGPNYGSADLNHAMRWYGNLIIQYATAD
ncbi:MAG TPA: M14 family metallopeptidase [Ardenticatenaceae bacterium]